VSVDYSERAPIAPLAPFVEAFWWMRGSPGPAADAADKVLPDGCLELVLHRGDRFSAGRDPGRLERQPSALLVGQLTGCLFLRPGARVDSMGIRFRPGGALPFLGPRVHELTGQVVELGHVWGRAADELEDTVAGAAGRREQAQAAERWLLRRLASAPARDRPVEAAVRAIVSRRGTLAVSALGGSLGVSARQLERRFRAAVGLPPKTLARVVRLQAVLQAVSGGGRDWAGLALDHGYFDQPHLIRDFQELAGESPARLLARMGELGRRFIAPERLAALFAPGEEE
jgi:AraC-like DNA-binding protein